MRPIAFYALCMQGQVKEKTEIKAFYIFKYDFFKTKLNIT